ncbi:negative regulation of DNA replication [Desmophyllum pertusum]|uniref:Negative regulation of DNA replication n=1 Tax=Desmophyllum pertusum TaxID=174260 RepID=A0A9W9YJ29_9CNID|nr:negative regulation of DNA replication [Desmophyllum pertusum]
MIKTIFPPMGSNRRITPTQVKSDGKKGKSSPAFTSSPFASSHPVLESHGSPASLQEERNMLKLIKSKKKKQGDCPWGNRTSPSPQSGIRSPQLHVLGDFIKNLVPNVTAELYFVVQLLTARGIAPEPKQDEDIGKADNQNVLDSIHNCAYFAVAVLQEIQRCEIMVNIADFSPSLKETFLQQYKTYSLTKVSELNFIKSPLGGVPFSVERDNKQNFPTDRAFHNFRKQRDVFYELVREWEDSHSAAGWNMEEYMGERIRALVNQKPELANYSHFARLFKSQLLQMWRRGKKRKRFPFIKYVKAIYKNQIPKVSSHSFNQHLTNLLIVKIDEFGFFLSLNVKLNINDKEFPLSDIEEGSEKDLSIQNQELKQELFLLLKEHQDLGKVSWFPVVPTLLCAQKPHHK